MICLDILSYTQHKVKYIKKYSKNQCYSTIACSKHDGHMVRYLLNCEG